MARIQAVAETMKGLKAANIRCLENLSPVSRVAIYVKAGSRYEPEAVPGISHFMRASAGITTERSSVFSITRSLEKAGASFNVFPDREHLIYRLDCLRDKLKDSFNLVADTLSCPEFRTWELADYVRERLQCDLDHYGGNQSAVLNEALNKAAFRGGLAHSMYTPRHQIKSITQDDALKFFTDNYVTSRMTFIGLGVDEDEFNKILASSSLSPHGAQYDGVDGASRYVGGESRIQGPFKQTMVALVGQAPGINDQGGCANMKLFQAILGGFGPGIKYSVGSERSLAATVASVSPYVKTSIVNINYSDTGLFGFTLHGPNEALRGAVHAAIGHFKKVAKGVTEEDLSIARTVVKARSLIESENHDSVFASMGTLASNGMSLSDQSVDKVKLTDVKDTVSKVIKGKQTIVSVGNPRYIPYLDELEN